MSIFILDFSERERCFCITLANLISFCPFFSSIIQYFFSSYFSFLHSKSPSEGCHENYIGETNRRIVERIQDNNNRDKTSHLLKHAREKSHTHVWENDFKILGNNYESNIKRNISELLYIRQLKPNLNGNEK